MRTVGSFDYIIVGAGTAGCVLANRLTQDRDVRVLLLEAGGADDWVWIHIPVGYLYCIGNPRTDWCYVTEPEPGLNGRSIGYARGRVLGGCSSINAMLYLRGQRQDYDRWRDLGNPGWGWEDVLPVFKRSEDHHAGADAYHGAGGEWRVERQRLRWDLLDAFREAAAQTGIPKTEDFNRGDNEGCGFFEVNQRRGVRWSAAKAFLRPAMRRSNLTVLTHAPVKRLRLQGKRVSGVEFYHGGEEAYAESRVETVLAAGAIGSPQILQLSGIGPAALLRDRGVAVVHDLPGVGENLQDHLQLRMVYRVQGVRTLNEWVHHPLGKAQMALQYLLTRTGPMTMAPSQLGAFTRSDPSQPTPNLEYHIQPLSLDRFGEPLHTFPAFTASVCNLRPASRGSVRIKSPDARVAPAIAPGYLTAEADRRVAADALRLTRRIVAAPALERYHPQEWLPGPHYQTDDELVQAAGDIGTTIFHPVGTCKMGNDPMAVVDARLRVHGVAGLRVVDASIMPFITSGNTNSPTLMIAEKGSDMIREDRRRAGASRSAGLAAAATAPAAPVQAAVTLHMAAAPETVWAVLTDVARWPAWNPAVKWARLDGPLAPGVRFQWKAGPGTITSRVTRAEPPRRLVWQGETLGIRAVHAWRIDPEGDGALVTSEESWDGVMARLLPGLMRRVLRAALDAGVAALKEETERRTHGLTVRDSTL